MKIIYGKVSFLLDFEKPISWNTLPTLILSSLLGTQLKRICCVQRQLSCEKCNISQSCAYAVLFESPIPKDTKVLPGRNRGAHPFVLTHGKVINSDSDLILGHDYKKPTSRPDLNIIRSKFGEGAYNEYLEELSSDDVRVTEGNDIINSYFTSTYKPTSDIIKENKAFFNKMKNIKEVIIIGHSLGKVDLPYFEEIYKRINNSKVKRIVTYYKEEEILKHRQFLKNLGVKDKQINIVKMDYFYPTRGVLFA